MRAPSGCNIRARTVWVIHTHPSLITHSISKTWQVMRRLQHGHSLHVYATNRGETFLAQILPPLPAPPLDGISEGTAAPLMISSRSSE